MRISSLRLSCLALLLAIGGCQCGDPPVDDPDGGPIDVPPEVVQGLRLLTLDPADVELVVRDTTPATQRYRVTGHYEDDSTRDVTAFAEFFLDDARLGTFHGDTFTSNLATGGTSAVRASVATWSAEGTLMLRIEKTALDPDPSLPANPETFFQGDADPARAPLLAYPNDGVLLPPNLGRLEVHFRRTQPSNTLFELAFTAPQTDVRVYTRCRLPTGVNAPYDAPDACIHELRPEVWTWLSSSHRGAGPLTLVVRATDDSGSGTVGTSEPITLNIARSDLQGGLYYWTTAANGGIMRYDFSSTSGTPVRAVAPEHSQNTCVGCHALSRDGRKLVASGGGQDRGETLLYSVASNTPLVPYDSTPKGQFFAWSPDGSQFAGVYGDAGSTDWNVRLFNGTTGALEASLTGTGTESNPATHPDWSADGEALVYVRQGIRDVGTPQNRFDTNQRFGKGSIHMVRRTGSDFGAPVTVVPAASGKNRYYPAVAPSSDYLVFNESTCPTDEVHRDCNADTDPSARLFVAPLSANATPIPLVRANTGGVMDPPNGDLTNSYPRWNPFEVRGEDGPESKLHWLTFSSSRRYGLRLPPAGGMENPKGTLLWMAAVDPARVAAGEDGSFPAFVLPIQDVKTSNHVAQWAQYTAVDNCAIDGEGCHTGGASCCGGLTCTSISEEPVLPCDQAGNCVCQPNVACGVAGESCNAASPCCGGLACQGPGGGACTGADCLCQPACGSLGQACGAGSPCCGGLLCLTPSGSACEGEGCVCLTGID